MSPRTLFSVGTSIQKNIGLDRQTLPFLPITNGSTILKKTIQLEIFNTQYIQNQNIDKYFSVYSSEFTNLTKVARAYTENPDFNFPERRNPSRKSLELDAGSFRKQYFSRLQPHRIQQQLKPSQSIQYHHLRFFNSDSSLLVYLQQSIQL